MPRLGQHRLLRSKGCTTTADPLSRQAFQTCRPVFFHSWKDMMSSSSSTYFTYLFHFTSYKVKKLFQVACSTGPSRPTTAPATRDSRTCISSPSLLFAWRDAAQIITKGL